MGEAMNNRESLRLRLVAVERDRFEFAAMAGSSRRLVTVLVSAAGKPLVATRCPRAASLLAGTIGTSVYAIGRASSSFFGALLWSG